MSRFSILLAGSIDPTPRLRDAVAATRVIAADRGMMHAGPLGVAPELWIGDFDSAGPALDARFADVPRETFPRDKDRTDGELAIEAALARGASEVLLVGACGGPRTDHAFMHLVLALRYAGRGIAVSLFDGRERGYPIRPGTARFDAEPGAAFSILKFTDLRGLSIRGAKWPLTNIAVPFPSILTQSNEATGPIEIELSEGVAIVLIQVGAKMV